MTTFLAVLAIANALGLGGLVLKMFPPRLSKAEKDDRQEKRIDELEADLARCHATINTQADYIFQLREHIALAKPPPPPPWPEGMKV